ncbi:hypothetical protein EV283_3671 [Sphingomonas sp. BK036]|nr:hypothetical protein EV283_3671 [Sphingomonas sp. BK036]
MTTRTTTKDTGTKDTGTNSPPPSSRRTPGPTDTQRPLTVQTATMGPGVRRGDANDRVGMIEWG